MAGCLPTKTTIRIRSSNGEFTDVDGATTAQAGVMTAAHVARLDAVEKAIHSSDGTVIFPPAAAPRIDSVTRNELGNALTQLRAHMMTEVGQALSAMRPSVPAADAPPISLDAARLELLSNAVVALSERMDALEQRFAQIGVGFEVALAEKAA